MISVEKVFALLTSRNMLVRIFVQKRSCGATNFAVFQQQQHPHHIISDCHHHDDCVCDCDGGHDDDDVVEYYDCQCT